MAPTPYTISRSIDIAASPSAVFEFINDFHRWPAWSPWEKVDPNMKRTYSGPDSGFGAAYSWEGNSKAGKGDMTITKSEQPSAVGIDLNFLKPFAAQNKLGSRSPSPLPVRR